MWLFLATEVMFFGGLFAAYSVYRFLYPDTFRELSRHLDVTLGTLNTAVLLTSSYFMARAVHAARKAEPGQFRSTVGFLVATQLFGCIFLIIKAKEWIDDYHHSLFPGHWGYHGPSEQTAELFFYLYYAMVGLHALHVLIGIGLLAVLTLLARGGRYSKLHHGPIEILGLYWHYVDIVWVFLYPLFYLVDPK
jgi:cytochrome c oxidase subunit 3